MTESKKNFCTWTSDAFEDCWETDCEKSFYIEDGTPKDNNMNFCCFCGKPLKTLIREVEE